MIIANLFPQIAAQQDIPPSAPISDGPSAEPPSAMPNPFDLTEHRTVTPFLFLPNQQGTPTDLNRDPPSLGQKGLISDPMEAEELPTTPPQSDLVLNQLSQNDRIPGLPFFEDSIDPESIKPELPRLTEPPKVIPQPQLSTDRNLIFSVHPMEMGLLGQNLSGVVSPDPVDPLRIIPTSQLVSNEEGLNSLNLPLAQSPDRSPFEIQVPDLQRPPIQTIDFVGTKPPKPAERMILGEQNRPHRDGAFIVDPPKAHVFITGKGVSGDEGSPSLVRNSLVPPRVGVEQGMVSENVNWDPLSSKPSLPPEEVSFQPFSIHESISKKDEKRDLLKEWIDFRPDPSTVEVMNQKTEKPAFPPETPFTTEKRLVTNSFEQEVGEVKRELWAKSEPPAISGTKDTESVAQSWMFTGHKAGAEFQNQAPEEIPKGQGQLLPKAEDPEIFQQIAKKVVWSIRNNEEKIKLTLEPPELGSIYMEINRKEGNIRTTLWTDNLITKGILEAHQIQFYRILERDGFHLEEFNVFIHQEGGSFQERGESPTEYGRWSGGRYKEEKGPLSSEPFEINAVMNLPHRGSQYVDLFA